MNKILIIEDDLNIRKVFEEVLDKYGKIFCAINETETLKLIDSHSFDLIIADFYLGKSNGLEIVKSIQNTHGQIPVILISAYPTVDMLADGIELKIHSFMRKPIDFDQLSKKVESLFIFNIQYQFNGHEMSLSRSTLTLDIDHETFPLTHIQFKLIKYILGHLNQIIEREKMIESIWGTTKLSSENTLDTHLLILKKKIPFLKEYLKTLPKIGYQLISSKN